MLAINLNSPVPIYEQLVNGIKGMIEIKELKPGTGLPTIRSLASQLEIAINTVARAYQELESMGLIESKGRKGSFVRETVIPSTDNNAKIFKPAILKLLQKGMNRGEIEQIFKNNLNNIFD